MFASRNRQPKSKRWQDIKIVQDRLARIETLLPNQSDATSKSAQEAVQTESSMQDNENQPSAEGNFSTYLTQNYPEPASSRPQLSSGIEGRGPGALSPNRPPEEPTQAAGEPFVLPPLPHVSPSQPDRAFLLPSTPSLTITTNIGEDDGSCSMPPEEEVRPQEKLQSLNDLN